MQQWGRKTLRQLRIWYLLTSSIIFSWKLCSKSWSCLAWCSSKLLMFSSACSCAGWLKKTLASMTGWWFHNTYNTWKTLVKISYHPKKVGTSNQKLMFPFDGSDHTHMDIYCSPTSISASFFSSRSTSYFCRSCGCLHFTLVYLMFVPMRMNIDLHWWNEWFIIDFSICFKPRQSLRYTSHPSPPSLLCESYHGAWRMRRWGRKQL